MSVIFIFSAQSISLVRYLLSSRPDLPFQKLRFFGYSASVFMLMVGLGLIRDLVWLTASLAETSSGTSLGADFLRGNAVNLALLLICGIGAGAGCLIAYQPPVVRRLCVTDGNLPPELDGLCILHVTDLHIGSNNAKGWPRKCVELINASQPDLILISGDLADGVPDRMQDGIRPLSGLRAKYGIFVCLGNHEYYAGAREWTKTWRQMGMTVLVNDFAVLEHNGASLVVAGLADSCAEKYQGQTIANPKELRGKMPAGYALLLCHRPSSVSLHAELGYNFQFSGHTHGGQFPLMFPLVNYLNGHYRKGLYRKGTMWLHVGQGAGFWGYVPMRLLTRPEVTEIALRRPEISES